MVKLIALYREPADREGFDRMYFEVHIPLAEKMPGLKKVEISRLKSLGPDNKYYMQTEMYFDDINSLNSAMGSSEGKDAAKNLMSFAKDIVEMSIGEIQE